MYFGDKSLLTREFDLRLLNMVGDVELHGFKSLEME